MHPSDRIRNQLDQAIDRFAHNLASVLSGVPVSPVAAASSSKQDARLPKSARQAAGRPARPKLSRRTPTAAPDNAPETVTPAGLTARILALLAQHPEGATADHLAEWARVSLVPLFEELRKLEAGGKLRRMIRGEDELPVYALAK